MQLTTDLNNIIIDVNIFFILLYINIFNYICSMNKSPIYQKLVYIDSKTNKKVFKNKKKYKHPEETLRVVKIMNNSDKQIHKVEAYKCTTCLRFHIGKTKKKLEK